MNPVQPTTSYSTYIRMHTHARTHTHLELPLFLWQEPGRSSALPPSASTKWKKASRTHPQALLLLLLPKQTPNCLQLQMSLQECFGLLAPISTVQQACRAMANCCDNTHKQATAAMHSRTHIHTQIKPFNHSILCWLAIYAYIHSYILIYIRSGHRRHGYAGTTHRTPGQLQNPVVRIPNVVSLHGATS